MKTAKRSLAVLLACLMVFGSFGVVGSAKFNSTETIEPVGDGYGTVTFGLDIYKVGDDDSLTKLSDGANLAPGDVVEVQIAFGTDFYMGLLSTQIFYDSNYFQPYLNGAVYTTASNNTFKEADGGLFKMLTDDAPVTTMVNGDSVTLFGAITRVEDGGYLGLANKGSNAAAMKGYVPLAWRALIKNNKPVTSVDAGCDIADEYKSLHFVSLQLTSNNQNGHDGANIVVPYHPYFSFQLQVKEGADSNGETTSIFIPIDAAKRDNTQTCNKLYATNTDGNGGYYSASQSIVKLNGQGFDLTNADVDFVIGEAAHEHSYGAPAWSWNDTYTEATATFTCACGDEQPVTTSKIDTTEVTPASCSTNQVVRYSASVEFGGETYTDTTANVEKAGTALGHSVDEPTWVWAADYTSATATFSCNNCDFTEDITTTDITTNTISEVSCTTANVVTYTAKTTFQNTEYSTTSEEVTLASATGHVWSDTIEQIDDTYHGRKCLKCEEWDEETKQAHVYDNEVGITRPATLTEPGLKMMECICGAQKEVEYTLEHDHSYGEPVWSWNDTFTEATATFTCECGDKQTVTTTEIDCQTIEDAECGKNARVQYTASVEFGDETYNGSSEVVEQEGTALSHSIGEPAWAWAADYTSATATFSCDNCDFTEDVPTTDITTNTISEQSCTTANVVTYTAKVTYGETEYTDTTDEVTLAAATGHSIGEPTWAWAADYTSATATFSCDNCDYEVIVDAVSIDATTVTALSCTTANVVTYTAKVTYGETEYTDTTDEVTLAAATGHSYGEPVWNWSADYSACTATFSCTAGDDTKEESADVTETEVTPAGCVTNKVSTYTAKVTFNDTEYTKTTEEITVPNSALGHTWGNWTYIDENYHGRTCTVCTTPDENQPHEWVKNEEESTPATTTAGGEDVFYCSGCHERKAVPTEKLDHEHVYGDPTWVWTTDFSSATATFGCTLCENTQTKTDSAPEMKEFSPATCTEPQKITYTATVSFGGQEYSDTTDPIDGEGATGHTYSVTAVNWASDYSSVTVTLTCTAGDDEQFVTVSTIGTDTIEEAGICGKDAVVQYTATVEIDGQSFDVTSDPVTLEGTALSGHEYDDPTWNWAEDYTEATATFKCKNCDDEHTIAADIDTTVVQALTCTDDKVVIYTAVADFNGDEYIDESDRVTVEQATGHDWTGSYEALDDDYHAVTCAKCGATDDANKQAHDFSIELGVIRESTVTEPGLKTVECSVCGHQKDVEFTEEHLHEYGDPTWTWNADYTSATATFACIDGDDEKTVTTTDIDCEELEEPECDKDQVVQYLASVEFNGETYETTSNPVSVEGTAIGHAWGEPAWDWAEDYTSATATFTCGNDATHKTVLTDEEIEVTEITPAGCESDQVVTYTASVTLDGTAYTDKQENITVADTATGHAWGEPVWVWADDHTSATATFTCTNDNSHQKVLTDNEIQITEVTPAGCENDQVVTYTASVTLDGTTYTGKQENVTVPDTATGHKFGEPTWAWADDYSSVTATFSCEDCDGTKTVTPDSSAITKTEVTPAGCENDQVVKYTVSVTLDGTTYTGTSGNVTVPNTATGHNWGEPVWAWNDDHTEATATFTCGNCGETKSAKDTSPVKTVVSPADATHDEVVTYTSTVTFDGNTYTVTTDRITVPGTALGEDLKLIAIDKDGKVTEGKNISVTVPYTRKGAVVLTLDANKDVTWEMTTTKNFRTMTLDGNQVKLNHLWILRKHKTVVVTATDKDGNKATCTVTLKLKWWQYLIHLILFGCLWY